MPKMSRIGNKKFAGDFIQRGCKEEFSLVFRADGHYLPHQILDRISRLALLSTTRRERQVIALHLYQDLPFPEVARRLNSTARAVRDILESICARERVASEMERIEHALTSELPPAKKVNKRGKK